MNDQKTRAALIVVATLSFSLMIGSSVQLYADFTSDINSVRLETARNLKEHMHPDALTWQSLLSVVGLCMGAAASMLVFVHRAQAQRMDQQRDELKSLRFSHDGLSSVVSTLVGRIDADREWMHRELSGWKAALEDTRSHTQALVSLTQRLKDAAL